MNKGLIRLTLALGLAVALGACGGDAGGGGGSSPTPGGAGGAGGAGALAALAAVAALAALALLPLLLLLLLLQHRRNLQRALPGLLLGLVEPGLVDQGLVALVPLLLLKSLPN